MKEKRPANHEYSSPSTSLGPATNLVAEALDGLSSKKIIERIWLKDYHVWSTEPTEIVDRLGWLDLPVTMIDKIPEMESFSRQIKDDGFSHVVILGMGGSSLGSVTLGETLGGVEGYPKLIVLDSTVPEAIQAVIDAIELKKTLFVVSSKSGTTIEPLLLYRYFRELLNKEPNAKELGGNFAAITDPGTPLVNLAAKESFRRTFVNPPDIGGRYSVMSYFGLVPAALAGLDIRRLLAEAEKMRKACAPSVPIVENPGAWWGATVATLARQRTDKLTIVTSPSLASFGLWAEQLVAESTGKQGLGVIPVVGEPGYDVLHYSKDRLFVYLRLDNDCNEENDALVGKLIENGHPVVVLGIRDKYELGGEFFRWEFATAVTGSILGVNPFDQPDVQSSKIATSRMLRQFSPLQSLPIERPSRTFGDLLRESQQGNYLAIMAYLRQTPETDAALQEIRSIVTQRFHIATTIGYGPRFLHSTGQLHKGGSHEGLFFQITSRHPLDVGVPQEPYTFGFEVNAQASGDLEALQAAGKNVAWIQLNQGGPEDVLALAETLRR